MMWNNFLSNIPEYLKGRTPPINNVFKAFELCSYSNLKVVMLSQDPYPQEGIATGIAFGNNCKPYSPSLLVLKDWVIGDGPHNSILFDYSLESWAKQGVLMLNSALTTKINKVGTDYLLWQPFIKNLLIYLSEHDSPLIYVLFGKVAQSYSNFISKNNTIFALPHPSYYARIGESYQTNVFYDINKILYKKTGEKIKWYEEEE